MVKVKNLETASAALIVVLAGGLRLAGLGRQSFWLDEIGQIGVASHPLPQLIDGIRHHLSPPLDYLITHFLLLFTRSEFWLRFPAALWGTGTVWMIYLLGKKIANRTVGLMAAALAATGPALYAYSQEARMYSLFGFLSAAAMYLLFMAITNSSLSRKIILLAVNVLGLYTHYFFFFVLILEVICVATMLWPRQGKFIRMQWAILGSLIFFIPWLSIVLGQGHGLGGGQLSYGVRLDRNFFSCLLLDFPTAMHPFLRLLYPLGLILGGVLLAVRRKRVQWAIGLWLVLAEAGFFILANVRNVVTPRNTIFVLPAYYLIIAIGIYGIVQWSGVQLQKVISRPAWRKSYFRSGHFAGAFLAVGISLTGFGALESYQNPIINPKPDWKAFSLHLDELTPLPEFFVDHPNTKVCIQFYYDPENFGAYLNLGLTGTPWKLEKKTGKKAIKVLDRTTVESDLPQYHGALYITPGGVSASEQIAAHLMPFDWTRKAIPSGKTANSQLISTSYIR